MNPVTRSRDSRQRFAFRSSGLITGISSPTYATTIPYSFSFSLYAAFVSARTSPRFATAPLAAEICRTPHCASMATWCHSNVTFMWLKGLVKRGLLQARTSAMEWPDHSCEAALAPPDGYIVNLAWCHVNASSRDCFITNRSNCSTSTPMGFNTSPPSLPNARGT